jgi:hypothetical protein
MEPSSTKSAFFEFDTRPGPDTFVVKLTDAEIIAHARHLYIPLGPKFFMRFLATEKPSIILE